MMHKASKPRDVVDRLYVPKKKKSGRRLASIEDSVDASIQTQRQQKMLWKTDYSDQNQYRQYKHQQNKNNQKTKTGNKTSAWTFQATHKRSLTQESFDMAEKGKPK